MKSLLLKLILLLLVFSGFHGISFCLELPVTVSETRNVSRVNAPVRGGIPFNRGFVFDIDEFRLLLGQEEIECQFKIASRWYDGSVKWVWLDFFATLEAGGSQVYRVLVNEGKASNINGIMISETASTITIDTGTITVTLAKERGSIFESVILKSGGVSFLASGNNSHYYMSGQRFFSGKKYEFAEFSSLNEKPEDVVLELNGPLHTIVKTIGRMVDSAGNPMADYICRYHFYKNINSVRIDFTFVDRYVQKCDESASFYSTINSLGLKIIPGFDAPLSAEISGGTANHIASLTQSDYIGLYQQGNPDQSWESIYYSLDGLLTGQSEAPHSGNGWIDLSSADRGISAGILYFWQMYPKKLVAKGSGQIDIQLYPDQAEPTRLYSGGARTHSILVSFHEGQLSDSIRTLMDGFQQELFPACQPEWYCSSKTFGDIPVKDFKPWDIEFDEVKEMYDARQKWIYDQYAIVRNSGGSLRTGNCYGFWNFGDCFEDLWGNEKWEVSHGMYLEFVRTADLAFLERANQGVRHWQDVDVQHSNYNGGFNGISFLGKPHYNPNNDWHDMGRDHQYNFSHMKGLLMADYYHLMGDYRAMDVMTELYSYLSMWEMLREYTDDYQVREVAAPLQVALSRYDMDNSPEALEKAKSINSFMCQWQDRTHPDRDSKGWGWVPIDPDLVSGFQSGFALETYMQYQWITGSRDLDERILKGAKWLIGDEPHLWTGAYDPRPDGKDYFNSYFESNYGNTYAPQGLMIPAALGRAFAFSGDERFLDIANIQIKGNSELRTTYAKTPKLLGEETRSMPYYLYFLSEQFQNDKKLLPSPPSNFRIDSYQN